MRLRLEARRAGTDGIHGVRMLLGIERSKGSGDIRFMVGGGRPKADHVVFFLTLDVNQRQGIWINEALPAS